MSLSHLKRTAYVLLILLAMSESLEIVIFNNFLHFFYFYFFKFRLCNDLYCNMTQKLRIIYCACT